MRLLMCCIALCFTTAVNAQAISDEMKADITTLLETTGALKIGEQMGNLISQQIITAMKSQNPNVPAKATELIIEVVQKHTNAFVSSPETLAGLIDIYAKHYTHDEIKALIEFYHTALGAKTIQAAPQIALESAQFGQALFVQRIPQMQNDIQDRLQAVDIQTQAQP